jgi:type I restriction enzyme R subunit
VLSILTCVSLKSDFAFLVENYNPAKKKQIGETELKRSADYNAYKENTENGVNRLKFWKHVKNEFTDVIEEEILPLNWR